ncbi:MAG TPA: hypothetical protein DEV93_06180 [Chloroflexi bacterium]|jgi:hypothetical protein|nr:hypothetical protein [Chloroflexota bacterium]
MVEVRFTTREYDEGHAQFETRARAELKVDGREVSIGGDRQWVSLEVGVVDPENGEEVTFEKDPERWATLLPLAYRSGDVTVETTGAMAGAAAGSGRGSGAY